MTARHHTSGKFATRGARPSRTEPKHGAKAPGNHAANAAFNAHAARASKPAAKATAGQLVAAGAIK